MYFQIIHGTSWLDCQLIECVFHTYNFYSQQYFENGYRTFNEKTNVIFNIVLELIQRHRSTLTNIFDIFKV